uniref:Uncharacterized protein n=1 Tax=Anguilla anguilla TaxID=7936 RepID=A0A0E9X337_ANGAN
MFRFIFSIFKINVFFPFFLMGCRVFTTITTEKSLQNLNLKQKLIRKLSVHRSSSSSVQFLQ